LACTHTYTHLSPTKSILHERVTKEREMEGGRMMIDAVQGRDEIR